MGKQTKQTREEKYFHRLRRMLKLEIMRDYKRSYETGKAYLFKVKPNEDLTYTGYLIAEAHDRNVYYNPPIYYITKDNHLDRLKKNYFWYDEFWVTATLAYDILDLVIEEHGHAKTIKDLTKNFKAKYQEIKQEIDIPEDFNYDNILRLSN